MLKKLIDRIKNLELFKPECPRWVMGYKCHAGNPNYPNGCESCGRGAKK